MVQITGGSPQVVPAGSRLAARTLKNSSQVGVTFSRSEKGKDPINRSVTPSSQRPPIPSSPKSAPVPRKLPRLGTKRSRSSSPSARALLTDDSHLLPEPMRLRNITPAASHGDEDDLQFSEEEYEASASTSKAASSQLDKSPAKSVASTSRKKAASKSPVKKTLSDTGVEILKKDHIAVGTVPERLFFPGARRRYTPFSRVEKEDFLKALQICGVGNWKSIKWLPTRSFEKRTTVDLRDLFVTMKKRWESSARLDVYNPKDDYVKHRIPSIDKQVFKVCFKDLPVNYFDIHEALISDCSIMPTTPGEWGPLDIFYFLTVDDGDDSFWVRPSARHSEHWQRILEEYEEHCIEQCNLAVEGLQIAQEHFKYSVKGDRTGMYEQLKSAYIQSVTKNHEQASNQNLKELEAALNEDEDEENEEEREEENEEEHNEHDEEEHEEEVENHTVKSTTVAKKRGRPRKNAINKEEKPANENILKLCHPIINPQNMQIDKIIIIEHKAPVRIL